MLYDAQKGIQPSNRPMIYVAGPYKDTPGCSREYNRGIADITGRQIYRVTEGKVDIIIPHNFHPMWELFGIDDYEFFLSFDLRILLLCNSIYMLTRWNQSQGAILEHSFAVHKNIEIFYDLEEVKKWYDKLFPQPNKCLGDMEM